MRERPEARELSASVLRLTRALYRVTELLPHDEPLRRGIREKAGEIFSLGVAMAHGRMKEEEADEAGIAIEIMFGYLVMARTLGCVNPVNFSVLEREYRMFADEIASRSGLAMTAPTAEEKKEVKEMHGVRPPEANGEKKMAPEDGVNERQKKILNRIAQSRQVKISDLYEDFIGISSKTIQRDLQDLTTRNFIKKEGAKRWTMYMLA